jgi:hypothetical protein
VVEIKGKRCLETYIPDLILSELVERVSKHLASTPEFAYAGVSQEARTVK